MSMSKNKIIAIVTALVVLPISPWILLALVWLGYGEEVKAVLAYLGIV